MGKSKAEIQREYRKRKKLREGEYYFRKEGFMLKATIYPCQSNSKRRQTRDERKKERRIESTGKSRN